MSGLVLWMGALAIAVVLALGVGEVGTAAIERAQAAAAADAAALAGAAAGSDAAEVAASLNDAVLLSLDERGDVVTATVRIGQVTAISHAERRVVPVTKRP